MGSSRSVAEFAGKMQAAAKAMERAEKDAFKGVEREFKAAARRAVASDLGPNTPQGFSNWRRGRVIPLEVRASPHRRGGVTISPTRTSAGPWRVAEDGRNVVYGPLKPNITKSGRLSKRQPGRKRFSGNTAGRGTWSDTVAIGARNMPKKVQSEVVAAIKGALK